MYNVILSFVSGLGQYPQSGNTNQCQQQTTPPVPHPPYHLTTCMDVDSETDSNHDTALTLACAGGHEELVELLLTRGADIEHRDKKGFTPLILASTAGHEKVRYFISWAPFSASEPLNVLLFFRLLKFF